MIGDWLDIGPVDQIPPGNARTLPVRGGEEIAVFHTLDNQFYALVNAARTSRGRLRRASSTALSSPARCTTGTSRSKTGEALGEDKGCVPTIPLKVDAGRIYLLREAVIGRQPQAA
jgi:nitrite reductase (NADH) small subunit